jgi:hypothetical protein
VQLLWLFGRAGYQDAALMDLMHSIALKLQGAMDTESIAEVMFAEAQLGWADPRLQALVADYALDNMAVRGGGGGVGGGGGGGEHKGRGQQGETRLAPSCRCN